MSTLSPITVPEGKHVIRIAGNSGHTDHVYSPDIDEEVAVAITKFNELLAAKAVAFTHEPDGSGEKITEFDETAEQILVIPQYVGG